MAHGKANAALLAATDAKTRDEILANIAKHYGITPEQAKDEVIGEGAESILDYVTGPARSAVSVLMRRHSIPREDQPDQAPAPSGQRWGG